MSLRDQLQQIYDQHGKLTPMLVVETARDPDHPLHKRFDWDDESAAEAWRQDQAHRLIQKAKVVYKQASEAGPDKRVRAFHAVARDNEHVYEPAEKVATDPFLAQLVLRDMEREWLALKRRWEDFEEFWAMVRRDDAA